MQHSVVIVNNNYWGIAFLLVAPQSMYSKTGLFTSFFPFVLHVFVDLRTCVLFILNYDAV